MNSSGNLASMCASADVEIPVAWSSRSSARCLFRTAALRVAVLHERAGVERRQHAASGPRRRRCSALPAPASLGRAQDARRQQSDAKSVSSSAHDILTHKGSGISCTHRSLTLILPPEAGSWDRRRRLCEPHPRRRAAGNGSGAGAAPASALKLAHSIRLVSVLMPISQYDGALRVTAPSSHKWRRSAAGSCSVIVTSRTAPKLRELRIEAAVVRLVGNQLPQLRTMHQFGFGRPVWAWVITPRRISRGSDCA